MYRQSTKISYLLLVIIFSISSYTYASKSSSYSYQPNLIAMGKILEDYSKTHKVKFVIDPRVKSLVNMQGIKVSDMDYNTLLGILMTHGYISIKNGGAVYVIPSSKAKQTGTPVVKKGQKYADNEFVTEVIKVKHANAIYLLPMLRPLMPQHGFLSGHGPTNQIVITDHYGNVQRIKQIIFQLDIKQQKHIRVKPKSKTKSNNK